MRRELRRHAEWREVIAAMKTGAMLGSLHLDANTLKSTLTPITHTAQTQVRAPNCRLLRRTPCSASPRHSLVMCC